MSLTLLPDDPARSVTRVPDACWVPDYRQVVFGWSHPELPGDVARLRRSVGGDVRMT